jgi:putative transposase
MWPLPQKPDFHKVEIFGVKKIKTLKLTLWKNQSLPRRRSPSLGQSETGTRLEEICRQMGVAQAAFFNWEKKYGGLGIPDLRKLRQLKEENPRLKKLVADLSLDTQMLQDVIKKSCKSPYKKWMANWMVNNYRVSVQKACRRVRLPKSMYHYLHHRRDKSLLKMRINEIAQTRVRYGFERIFVLLPREGSPDYYRRVYRIYKASGLNLRAKKAQTEQKRCTSAGTTGDSSNK